MQLKSTMQNLETIPGPITSFGFPIIPYDTEYQEIYSIIPRWLCSELTQKLFQI